MPRTKLEEIAKRAALIKVNPNLRHKPNKNDLRIASENAELMAEYQYQTIKSEENK
ncbi:MAG: hypothetical protein FWH05_09150 [Oscillospiraceae bacterium]|nr:hypothetical protein [Oscillospiraceae bacterium]